MNDLRWYWVSLPYATFLVGYGRLDLIVKETAPIAKWAVGKNVIDVLKYYNGKGATIVKMCEHVR